jgi:hypothetical protein
MVGEEESLKIVPLTCGTCGNPMEADTGDVVFYCTDCGSGFQLVGDRIEPLEVVFLEAKKGSVSEYLPFWILDVTVQLRHRDARGGAISFISDLFGKGKSSGRRPFYIPAFDVPLPKLKELAIAFTRAQPPFTDKVSGKLPGGKYTRHDAEMMARYVFLSLEAQKPDTLQSLSYSLVVHQAGLLGVPFSRRGDGRFDAVLGIEI